MVISSRQADILEKVTQEYIKSAKPVSSQLLEEKYSFNICPATIRNEMQKLTDEKYLFQPHTSAGRVPTDKGYRFFVDNLQQEKTTGLDSAKQGGILNVSVIKDIFGSGNIFEQIFQVSKFLAETSSVFAITGLLDKKFSSKQGWEQIIKEPEFEDKDLIFRFADLLKDFEKDINGLGINSNINIYIGQESPFRKSKDFSIIISKCHFPEQEGFVSLLGPKRMIYQKNIDLIESLTRFLQDF